MKRSPMPRRTSRLPARRATARRSERVEDCGYLHAVHELPCCARDLPGARCSGPIEADHAGRRPLGRKADDATCIPLDRQCHRDRTDLTGPFKGWSRERMRAWLDEQIAATQARLTTSAGAAGIEAM